MRNFLYLHITFLLFLASNASIIAAPNHSDAVRHIYPKDSLLNKITDIDRLLKEFTEKDTLGGYSAPIKIETASYFKTGKIKEEPLRDRNGLIIVPFEYEPFLSYIGFADTVVFSPELLPIVFEGKLLPEGLDFFKSKVIEKNIDNVSLISRDSIVAFDLYPFFTQKQGGLIDLETTFARTLQNLDRIAEVRKMYYAANPTKVKSNAFTYNGSTPIINRQVIKQNPFKELITASDAISIAKPTVETYKIKQVFWKFNAEHSLQVAFQAYTKNWKDKTNTNFALNSYQKFVAEYRKNRIHFNHLLEWKLNMQYVHIPSSERNKENAEYNQWLMKEDYVRTYNKLGFDAFIKKWSYIFTLEGKTPLFSKRPQYSNKVQSHFLSPFDLNFGLGAGYVHQWKSKEQNDKSLKLEMDATPISIAYKLVKNERVLKNNRHGLKKAKEGEEQRNHMTEFGSTVTLNLTYKFNRYASLSSRLRFFTNYEKVQSEWENTFVLQLNKYLSTRIYYYAKFDDSLNRDGYYNNAIGYFSFSGDLSFGLNFKW